MKGNSERKRHDEAIDLGKKNVICIHGITGWCKHANAEMTSAGLYAEMTGLPIGMIEVTCRHASSGCGSMNLPLFLPEFVLKNCVGCKFHDPNGDQSWAQSIIHAAEKQTGERDTVERERRARLSELRKRLQEIPRSALVDAPIQERTVLELTEGLFDQDANRRSESEKRLVEAARVGGELFPPPAIDLLIDQALSVEFGRSCLAVCAELAVTRTELSDRLAAASCEAIRRNISPEVAAMVLTQLANKVALPLDEAIIGSLISAQSYYRHIGGWEGNREPEYHHSTRILSLSYDANPAAVLTPIKARLAVNDKHTRIDVCGVIRALRQSRPRISIELLPDLVASLQLDDDMYEDSADGAACREIGAAFGYDLQHADEFVFAKVRESSGEIQTLLVAPYERILRAPSRSWKRSERTSPRTASKQEVLAFARCWEFVRDERLDLKTRIDAAEALKYSCKYLSDLALPHFDAMLGYLALLKPQTEPPRSPPRIIIPGAPEEIPELRSLDESNRKSDWGHLKNLIAGALEELAEERPEKVVDSILTCYDTLDTTSHEEFKAALLGILGKLGQDYASQPRVIPALMKGLMAFDSVLLRWQALKALEETFRYAKAVPSDVLDIVVLHLQDQYVAVHKAAVQTIRWLARHLNSAQSVQALRVLANHAQLYKGKPHDLEHVAVALLAVSRRNPVWRKFALKIIGTFFPTQQELYDEKIAEDLCRAVDPDDENAAFVAKALATILSKPERDGYNSYEWQHRAEFFRWLHQMTPSGFSAVQEELLTSARVLAEHDPWEACHFASLFSKFSNHAAEAEIVKRAGEALQKKKADVEADRTFQNLAQAALSNASNYAGEHDIAAGYISQIREKQT